MSTLTTPAPLRFVMVPVTPTPEMLKALMSEGEADAAQGFPSEHLGLLMERAGIAGRYHAMLAAAPTTPQADSVTAHQQKAQEPYAYAVYFPDQPTEELVHDLDDLTDDLTNREHQITKLYTAPQPAPAPLSDDMAKDAARYRWLRNHGFSYATVDLGTDHDGENFVSYRITFHIPEPAHSKFEDDEWSAEDVDSAIDAALAAQGGAT